MTTRSNVVFIPTKNVRPRAGCAAELFSNAAGLCEKCAVDVSNARAMGVGTSRSTVREAARAQRKGRELLARGQQTRGRPRLFEHVVVQEYVGRDHEIEPARPLAAARGAAGRCSDRSAPSITRLKDAPGRSVPHSARPAFGGGDGAVAFSPIRSPDRSQYFTRAALHD